MTNKTQQQSTGETQSMVTPYGKIRFLSVTKVYVKGADGKNTEDKIRKLKISLEFDGQDPNAIKLRDWIASYNDKRITTIVTNPTTEKKEVLPNDNYILQFYWGLKDGKVSTQIVDDNNVEYEALPRFDSRDGDSGMARLGIKLATASNGNLFFQAENKIQLKDLNINLDGPHKTAKSSKYSGSMSALEAAIEAEHRGQA